MSLIIALAALFVSVFVLMLMNKRHSRIRRRMARLERRDTELLCLLKSTAARAQVDGEHPPALRSEWGEDLLILELFGWKREGFYIEVGAYDGRRYAVTAVLDTLGWTGLLIEPVPELYEQACRNRPSVRVVHAAVSRHGSAGTITMTHILPREGTAADASSHLADSSGKVATKRPPRGPMQSIEVPLTSIDSLLADHTATIDFISIDVEGHELDLLDGFDLDRFKPRVILIEDHTMDDASPIAAYLTARGYTHACWFAWNRLFIRNDETALLERAGEIDTTVSVSTRP